ncbi:ADP-forming succinate--CoA ligase subunit beta [Halosquirtibacter laminarini]|uniref:ADP-forming succinate--CoA ligase subunit beta n=1 Tax=Halosquirtibacter laminarini TaxID=3374600 RepID=A0AC61NHU9_9BACT|nr:ADP-forming succinate--CoA ligase subunit beta [Prolixibacteraceae bacterium]
MKLHEYQAKEIFRNFLIHTPKEKLCLNTKEAIIAFREINKKVVVKAQVHTGGRGKAGGIKLASNEKELQMATNTILGMDIKGHTVEKLLISEAVDIQKEYYVGITIDRSSHSILLMISAEGGVEIEEVAAKTPEKIHKYHLPITPTLPSYRAREIAFDFFQDISLVRQFADTIEKMYLVFVEKDASLVEINPLVITSKDRMIALDAKMSIDENAMYRHHELESYRDSDENEQLEQEAKQHGLSYIKLDGSIGCMVNGAGLAMATMDMIKLYGGTPANFLDIGGSSNPNKVKQAMHYLTQDPNVKAIMINIFGGITRCDDVAHGLLQAFEEIEVNLPIVVRLSGTNAKEGLAILSSSTKIDTVSSMSEAAKRAISYLS